ncbi:hypothetical protein A2982_02205 [candidate division WWE3 bacterium RIFCSPLOWO2_01_FULL_39_13]|uniref:Uncharacterized protein n=1 Tax=candidate division WWE3 bacterium RIFCSPLOWO2_01_FULL_39_13 TaxID=1802624 RepID=A0A1F4V3W5_UNCKA|nr:MAG: hypothetical protein A2982_02205 [candidate division WWE3 bacterium RIFCSPLOWO2_01_FULL_39_13]
MLIPAVEKKTAAPNNGTGENLELPKTLITEEGYDLSTLTALEGDGERAVGDEANPISIAWTEEVRKVTIYQEPNGTPDPQPETRLIPTGVKAVSVFVTCPVAIENLANLGLIGNIKPESVSFQIRHDGNVILLALTREAIPATVSSNPTWATAYHPNNPLHKEKIINMLRFISEQIARPPNNLVGCMLKSVHE